MGNAMLACDGSKPSEVVSPSSGADSQQARLIKCLPTKAAELTIVAHGLLELLHVFFGKSTARQGKYDGVLPLNVAPIALEKASQHISHHVWVINFPSIGEDLETFEKFAGEAFIGRML